MDQLVAYYEKESAENEEKKLEILAARAQAVRSKAWNVNIIPVRIQTVLEKLSQPIFVKVWVIVEAASPEIAERR